MCSTANKLETTDVQQRTNILYTVMFPQKCKKVNKIHSEHLLLSLKPSGAEFVVPVDSCVGEMCVCVSSLLSLDVEVISV